MSENVDENLFFWLKSGNNDEENCKNHRKWPNGEIFFDFSLKKLGIVHHSRKVGSMSKTEHVQFPGQNMCNFPFLGYSIGLQTKKTEHPEKFNFVLSITWKFNLPNSLKSNFQKQKSNRNHSFDLQRSSVLSFGIFTFD